MFSGSASLPLSHPHFSPCRPSNSRRERLASEYACVIFHTSPSSQSSPLNWTQVHVTSSRKSFPICSPKLGAIFIASQPPSLICLDMIYLFEIWWGTTLYPSLCLWGGKERDIVIKISIPKVTHHSLLKQWASKSFFFKKTTAGAWVTFTGPLRPRAIFLREHSHRHTRRSLHYPPALWDSSTPSLELDPSYSSTPTEQQNEYHVTNDMKTQVLKTPISSPE